MPTLSRLPFLTSAPVPPARLQEPSAAPKENAPGHVGSKAQTSMITPEPPSPDAAWADGSGENGHWPGPDLKITLPAMWHCTAEDKGSGLFGGNGDLDLSEIHIPEAQKTEASPGHPAADGGGPGCEQSVHNPGSPGAKPHGAGLGDSRNNFTRPLRTTGQVFRRRLFVWGLSALSHLFRLGSQVFGGRTEMRCPSHPLPSGTCRQPDPAL